MRIIALIALLAALAGCGKKPADSSGSAPSEKPKAVSAETLLNQPPSDQPAAAAPADAPPAAVPQPPPPDAAPAVSEAAKEEAATVTPKKEDLIQGWLHKYHTADAAGKTQIISEIRAAKLTAAEMAYLEAMRSHYGYQPMPLK